MTVRNSEAARPLRHPKTVRRENTMHTVVNTEQAEAWNGYEGNHWADHQDRYDMVNNAFNAPLLDAAAVGERDRVLDVGCGNGQVTRLAARRARLGHAFGIDLSAPMLRRARASAAEEGLTNVTFERGDAQIYPFPGGDPDDLPDGSSGDLSGSGGFDVAVSRFGIMFFSDPVAAFANIGRALRPGGRLAMLSMRSLHGHDLAPVFTAMARHLPARPASTEPGRPGPESLADPARIHEVLTGAGFENVASTAVDAPQVWGKNTEEAAAFLGAWGPVRFMLGQVDEAAAARALDALTEAMRPFEEADAVRLRGAAWLITATRS
ncbi:class I SAM-dependent methyltransferase [Streptosporangium sp. NPDC051022]|uniref:class I SAM-dependent methyltransferase n=1 Tax=Streptosporangium sp. NPDC051022 TaxID=3155752 RepID=UPI00343CDD89